MNRPSKHLSVLFLAAAVSSVALVGCGGGGGSAGTTSPAAPTPPAPAPVVPVETVPAAVELSASADSVASANGTVQINATVKAQGNTTISGRTVTFTASSGTILSGSAVTNANGLATTNLTVGSDRSNRNITVTAVSGAVSSQITVPVTGSRVTIAGTGSLLVGAANTAFTIRAQDSAGNPIANARITVQSSLGNGLSASTVTTDAAGVATVNYTPTRAGSDVVSIAGIGATAQLPVTVSAQDFLVSSPASGALVAVSSDQVVSVRLRSNGAPVAGQVVNFSTTRGGFAVASAVTDANGVATAVVRSATAGPATVTASTSGTAVATQSFEFVATIPATAVIQASPTSISPNAAGSTSNRSGVNATIRDAAGNPVKNVAVNFSLVDPSGGTLSPATGVTDSNGVVQTSFIPGSVSTASNGVVVTATVAANPSISASTTLTVSGRSVFITLAVGNQIEVFDVNSYKKPFAVYVTDSNGAAVKQQQITFSLLPLGYRKGSYGFNSSITPPQWVGTQTASCANEDLNFDGILSVGEDLNGDGRLTPGGVAVVQPASITTNDDGYGTFSVLYGKQYATWVDALITAKTLVAGTESSAAINFGLSALASDVSNPAVAPPFVRSPFGTSSSCNNAQ